MNTNNNTTEYEPDTNHSGNSLFIAGAIPIILSLIVPASAILADILLAFCLFVGAAITVIAFSNIKSADLKGFAGMVMSASVVRIFTSIILVRLLLTPSAAGIITEKIASPMQTTALLSTIAAVALILILTGLTMHRVRIIASLKSHFFRNIIKDRHDFVTTAERTNNIDRDQVDRIRLETNTFGSFFATINTCSKFIFCENILAICALIFGITGIIIVSATPDFPPEAILTKSCQLTIAFSMLTILSLLSAVSMSKISVYYFETAKNINETPEQETAQRRTVSSTIAEPVIECTPSTDVITAEIANNKAMPVKNDIANVQDTNWQTENDLTKFILWQKRDLEKSKSIQAISDVITGQSFDKDNIILIASDNIKSLPVTVPVNIAVELSNAGLKCLIVDLDLKREAISRVFDIPNQNYGSQQYITDSGVDGISLICAGLINDTAHEKIETIIESSTKDYDRILVYAPDIQPGGKTELIINSTKSAMLFGSQTQYNKSMSKLRNKLQQHNCDFIEPDEVLIEN